LSLIDGMLEQLAVARSLIEAGQPAVPAWRIYSPDGTWIVLTPFDMEDDFERKRVLAELARFMAWRMAVGFIVTAETYLDIGDKPFGQAALLAIGITRRERIGVVLHIQRGGVDRMPAVEWLPAEQIDEAYGKLLPNGTTSFSRQDIMDLMATFKADGPMPTRLLD
jgi:hypothetical protein